MRKLHKGLIIGGATLAVLIPAGFVAADQFGNGNGQGRGNGTMNHECTQDQTGTRTEMHDRMQDRMQDRIQARDGTGPNHDANSAQTQNTVEAQDRIQARDGTGQQMRNGR